MSFPSRIPRPPLSCLPFPPSRIPCVFHPPPVQAAHLAKSCPELSKLSPPIRSPSVPVHEAVFTLFNVDSFPPPSPSSPRRGIRAILVDFHLPCPSLDLSARRAQVVPGCPSCLLKQMSEIVIIVGSSGIIVDGADGREIVERYLENGKRASIRPPPRGGCRPEEDGLWIASAERKERAAGGVLRVAVDVGFLMVHLRRD